MNETGDVIGVATMMIVGGQNLNYAVPIRYVRPLLALGEAPRRFEAGLLPIQSGGLVSADPPPPPVADPPTDLPPLGTYEAYVVDRLAELGAELEASGYGLDQEYLMGSLSDDASEDLYLDLYAGNTYQILAACDSDCSDLDLIFYGPDGEMIVEDRGSGATAQISIDVFTSMQFRTEVKMYQCSTPPCFYGVAVYTN